MNQKIYSIWTQDNTTYYAIKGNSKQVMESIYIDCVKLAKVVTARVSMNNDTYAGRCAFWIPDGEERIINMAHNTYKLVRDKAIIAFTSEEQEEVASMAGAERVEYFANRLALTLSTKTIILPPWQRPLQH